jgi:microcystin-dependent protein
LRSCRQGSFRVFRDDPARAVAGRYYFSPPATPVFPGWTLLGSRTWDDTNLIYGDGLGEVRGTPDKWDSGQLPEVVPDALQVGSADCIANGEQIAHAIPFKQTIAGYPSACFLAPEMPDPNERFLFRIFTCETQRFYAAIIAALYDEDDAQVMAIISRAIGTDGIVTIHPHTDHFPAVVTIVNENWSVAIHDGTRTNQLFALQAFMSLVGPQDFGRFSTLALWYAASQLTLDKLAADGANNERPTLYVGHSYGAATAAIAAVRNIPAGTRGKRSCLTFGMPKPGDERFKGLLAQVRSCHLATNDDLIAILPPAQILLWMLTPVLGLGVLTLCPGWETSDAKFILFDDGTETRGNPDDPGYATLLDVVSKAIAHVDIDIVSAHLIETYAARLALRCPTPAPAIPFGELLLSNRPIAPQHGLTLRADFPSGRLLARGKREAPGTTCANAPRLDFNTAYKADYKSGTTQIVIWNCKEGDSFTFSMTTDLGSLFTLGNLGVNFSCTGEVGLVDVLSTPMVYSFTVPAGYNQVELICAPGASINYQYNFRLDTNEEPVMTGQIILFGSATPPLGYLSCDGSAVSRTTFSDLFAVIGTSYGVGDGSTTFNVPDLRGRTPIGNGTGAGLTARSIGQSGGEQSHVLTTSEMPAHFHTLQGGNTVTLLGLAGTGGVNGFTGTGTRNSTDVSVTNMQGAGATHNNMQPWNCCAFCIKT